MPLARLLRTAVAAAALAAALPVSAHPAASRSRVADAQALAPLGQVKVGGVLGDRCALSARNRLMRVDEAELLGGYRHRPGSHPWIGEHVGKWLHAASLACAQNGDPALRSKLDRVAAGLIATQEPDGYMGTYAPAQRFGLFPNADWDVWSHKYCLIGLLAYHQLTGDPAALSACRRIGDLLIVTFGPGGKSINSAGTHLGMAATSILEPVVLLHRATGDARYLAFAHRIVDAWEEPGAPHIISSLLRYRSVRRVANGKAYEMLSNLVGLCELYRTTGDRRFLTPVLIAWQDIVDHRLYITGSGSVGELWQDEFVFPNSSGASICETCVTVTWEQLNIQLLRLLGEPRFAAQIERTVYNHLLGAQSAKGDDWSYYTPLVGRKAYDAVTHCCHSSGPRGVALAPACICTATTDGVAVNLFSPSRIVIPLSRGEAVIDQATTPAPWGDVRLTVGARGGAAPFVLRVRIPAWARSARVRVNGAPVSHRPTPGAYLRIARRWGARDRVDLRFAGVTRIIAGDHDNAGRAAITVGPLVMAFDEADNPKAGPAAGARIANAPTVRPSAVRGAITCAAQAAPGGPAATLRLRPYYAAGASGGRFAVWLRRGSAAPVGSGSLFAYAAETRSREGNQNGSIVDEDFSSFCVTFDGARQTEDWFAAALPGPVRISRVVYAHGRSFHDGGWFDTSAGKPRIQIRRTPDSAWEDVATLDAYPASVASADPGVRAGQRFEVRFAPVNACAIRIVGVPSCGDNPAQSFSSCGELQAFGGP